MPSTEPRSSRATLPFPPSPTTTYTAAFVLPDPKTSFSSSYDGCTDGSLHAVASMPATFKVPLTGHASS